MSIENYKTDFALVTHYKYDNYGNVTEQSTFGKELDTLSAIYKYDGSHRLVTEKTSKPLNTITKYTYDQFDNLASETDATDKSNPLKTTYKYDNWGLNTETIFADSTIQSTIRGWNGIRYFIATLGTATPWTKKTYDNAGHTVKEETIAASSVSNTSVSISDYSYESFTYDASDRLTKINNAYEYQYAPNGNILSQTGIGDYEYKASQPHAVTHVDNANGKIKSLLQKHTYTPLRKPATIIDDGNKDSVKKYVITYSPDNERIKSVYTCNKENITTYYLPDYEVENANGVITTRHYIFSPATGHLAAVNFKQGGKSQTYYAITDHLGSVLKLTDTGLHPKFEATYTPFGVRTIVKNDLGYNFPRGYTMHEHLDAFGVINANARLYDPYLARFLTPDPYIQEPTNPQNFVGTFFLIVVSDILPDHFGEQVFLHYMRFTLTC